MELLLGFIFFTLAAATVKAEKLPVSRIVNGNDAVISEFPYQVSILLEGDNNCGGSIYNPSVIITAAHCLFGVEPSDLTVRAGTSFRQQGGILTNVARIIIHPKYRNYTHVNDIGLLVLETPLPLGSTIRSVPLITETPADGAKAVLTGFGQTTPDKPVYKDQLQYTEVEIISFKKCRSKRYGHGNSIRNGMICAGGGETNTCYGDSGGPMVVDDKLAGVTSWGPKVCAKERYPGIYTNIAHFAPWIISNAKKATKK